MIVVNLFAGPGASKSTTAAGIFYYLKSRYHINCEYVSEYAKIKTWEGHYNLLTDQLYITAQQNRALMRLIGNVDLAISDSPLLLGLHYRTPSYLPNTFAPLLNELFDSYVNINYFLERDPNKPYMQKGRTQTRKEAEQIDKDILNMLTEYDIPFQRKRVTKDVAEEIANELALIFKK